MDAKFVIKARRQLTESISSFEAQKGKTLTPAARIMLEAILMESLTTRESEWRTRGEVLTEAYGSVDKLGNRVSQSFGSLLEAAYLEQAGDFVTTRDLLAAAQKKWCNIFPIC